MANSLLADLLKTPSQVREEQMQKLRTEGLERAGLLKAPTGAQTALPSIYTNIARSGIASAGENVANIARLGSQGLGGLLSAAGAEQAGQALAQATVTPEERQAAQAQAAMQGINYSNIASLKAAAQKLKELGNVQVAAALEKRIADLATAQAEVDIKEREVAVKEQEANLKSDLAYAAITLKVSEDVLKNSDPTSVGKALEMVEKDPAKLNEARKLLKAKPGAQTQITIDQKGESEFLKTLGSEQAKAYETSVENIQANATSVRTLNEMESVLNEGEIYTGFGAPVFLQASKALNLVGLGDEEKITRTETFMKTAAQEVLNIMGSGKLGAGTGLSDSDRTFAKEVVAGDISLDAQTIRRLIDVNRRVNVYAIKKHNQKVERLNQRYPKAKLQMEFYVGQQAVVDGVTYTYDGEGWIAK